MLKLIKFFIKKILIKILSYFNHSIIPSDELSALKKNTIIEEINEYEKNLITRAKKFTSIGTIPTWMLINSIKYINKNNIEGDFVEAGVFRGGNLIIFKELNDTLKLNNKIYAYDTYEGMPKPNEKLDIKWNNVKADWTYNHVKKNNWCKCSLDNVKSNLLTEINNLDNIIFIKGLVEDTLKIEKNLPKKISLLRLDTDFYESTKIELEILFPRLSQGGVLVIDDYGNWKGAKKAVDDYFKNSPFLIYLDHGVRMLIKN